MVKAIEDGGGDSVPFSASERLVQALRNAERTGRDHVELYGSMTLRDVGVAISAFNDRRDVGQVIAILEGPYQICTFRIRLASLIP